eukprot:1153242-Pelagomonas_calceolata.AAC.4
MQPVSSGTHKISSPRGHSPVVWQVMNGPETVPIKVVKREIAFSAAARHNNIVQLLDVFAEHAQLVIVVGSIEWCSSNHGTDLFARVQYVEDQAWCQKASAVRSASLPGDDSCQ